MCTINKESSRIYSSYLNYRLKFTQAFIFKFICDVRLHNHYLHMSMNFNTTVIASEHIAGRHHHILSQIMNTFLKRMGNIP